MSLEDSTKITADILSRFIKKTPLTSKLLSKPPFRFLHDLITESVTSTGWAQGLFTDPELNSENVKEKDAKVAFLKKIIDTVSLSTGVTVRANPLKIVAGLEPEETNAFLQLLGKAIIKKVPHSEAVERVLFESSGHQDSTTSVTEETENRPPERPARPPSASQQRRPPPPAEIVKKQTEEVEPSAKVVRRSSDAGSKDPKKKAPAVASSSSNISPARSTSKASEPSKRPSPSRPATKTPSKSISSTSKSRSPGRAAPSSTSNSRDALQESNAPSAEDLQQDVGPDAEEDESAAAAAAFGSGNDMAGASSPPPQQSARQDTSMMEADDSRSNNISPINQQQQRLPPRPSSRMAPRPTTAKPPPPRERRGQKDAEEAASNVPVVFTESKIDTIDDEFLVSHAAEDVAMAMDTSSPDEKHGGLVRKILETRRDFDNQDSEALSGKPVNPKDKSFAAKEVEQVRNLIQTLCKSVMPLGKTLDYIQEDLDAMNREFGSWRTEANRYKQMLQDEVRMTEEILSPLEAQLKVVEGSIEEQLEKISAAKAAVVQNDEMIKRLKMTSAARPTWNPAMGGYTNRDSGAAPTKQIGARSLPSQLTLKTRQPGQNAPEDIKERDLKKQLEEAEGKLVKGKRGREDDDEERATKRLESIKNIDADDTDSEDDDSDKDNTLNKSNASDSDSDDDDEDDTAELLRELEKIKRERAEEKERQERERLEEEDKKREEQIASGNPLLSMPGSAAGMGVVGSGPKDFSVKRRWDDDVIFKNQAKGVDEVPKKRFINDMLRSDFHKKFMNKYVR
ncbi:hypothetical protein SmJEL517_g00373 [Synchytrium microbalum]|uniref:TRAF3-interacting protein 1 n=1 Tax=Synchytrium microbalum TaxID=1806994 RepID=A0A507CIS5_9FUNG|nr:uncharacterized protein SmJEL517_g00373 [Synchytrium microbalum]TPX38136.1 hypothetical protein SmJEL517_g00373 [Synchytrium microbalum]